MSLAKGARPSFADMGKVVKKTKESDPSDIDRSMGYIKNE
jgi:hypothetical protein